MLGQIDKSLKRVKSRLFLCKPNRETIAELTEASNKSIDYNSNGIHELTFRIPYVIERNHKFIRNDHVDILRGHFLIRYEKGNETHWFIINKPKNISQDGVKYKEARCFLLPYQLNRKIVRNYSGTKKIFDDVGSDGLLNETLLMKSDWTVGYIDADIATKYRTFNVSEKSLLEFITNDIVNAFDCIVLWDTVNKQVSFYKEDNIGLDRGLSIENGKYLKSIEDEPDFENVVTRLYAYGKDNLPIQKLNPSGSDYIENFSYYMYPFERDTNGNVLKHSNYMSDSLCHAILDYNDLLLTKDGEFNTLLSNKELKQEELTIKQNELFTLETELEIIQDSLDIANANGDPTGQLITDKNNKEDDIEDKKNEIDVIEDEIADIDSQINIIRNEISIENNFTHEQIIERDYYIHEKTWMNNHYDSEEDLYEQAIVELNKIKQPLVHYKIDIVDFLKVVDCQRDWDKLKQFDIVTIRYPEFNINIKAKIISINHNEDDNSISLEIANAKDINNGFLSMKDILNQAVTSSTTIDMSRFKWDKSISNENEINQIINNTWDATKRKIEAGVNESVDISKRGIIIKDPNDPMKFLVAQHSVLAITNDGGNTWKHAITPNGCVKERIKFKKLFVQRDF